MQYAEKPSAPVHDVTGSVQSHGSLPPQGATMTFPCGAKEMGSEMSKSSVPIVSCLFPVKVPGKLNHTEKENKRAKDKH